jgi:hypothetical protein
MKKWFARFVLVSGLYDLSLFIVFVFATPLLSAFLAIPVDVLSATLLQILGACLLGFGIALVVASRDLDRLLIIPVVDIPARLIGGASVIYHMVLRGLPMTLASFGIVDLVIAVALLAFIVGIKDYRIRVAFSRRST